MLYRFAENHEGKNGRKNRAEVFPDLFSANSSTDFLRRTDMSSTTQAQPDLGSKIAPTESAAGSDYKKAKCTYKSNGTFAGYLSSSTNAYVWLTQDPNQASSVKWTFDGNGGRWLEKHTSPSARLLGSAEQDYADWGLSQTVGASVYAEPVIYNSDHTISLASNPAKFLYGPYGDQWVCWGDNANVLVVELV
jgi:hypothetical protein